jgi:diguanylate cyclase (GGDEF)-like protein
VVNAAGNRRHRQPWVRLRIAYGLASLVLAGLYPVLPVLAQDVIPGVLAASAAASVAYGRRHVRRDRRAPWTLLLAALVCFVAAGMALLLPGEYSTTVRWLVDAVGNLLVLAAALALIVGRGSRDIGGTIDAAVVAVAVGSVLWAVLPHRLGADDSPAAQLNLFVVVVAFSGVAGALLRLSTISTEPNPALGWLLAAIGIAIVENALRAAAGANEALETVAAVLSISAVAAVGLFGLDPAAPYLMRRHPLARAERLSPARLAFLCAAVAAFLVVIGVRELAVGDTAGALLAAQGLVVTALVMLRIGVLAAEWARTERTLEHQASHDPLTQLLNRREFITRLRAVLAQDRRCAVIFCDLDDFKSVNDLYGHEAGDRLLIEVAQRLIGCVRPPHVVSRFGGDEFVVLLIDVTDEQVEAIRACLVDALAQPYAAGDGITVGITVGISVGVAYSDDGRDPELLLQAADRQMYAEKVSRGRLGRYGDGYSAHRS